jgi:hypothetical protein
MAKVLIRISEVTKKALDDIKVHPRETYDDIVQRLLEEESGLKWFRGRRVRECETTKVLERKGNLDECDKQWKTHL